MNQGRIINVNLPTEFNDITLDTGIWIPQLEIFTKKFNPNSDQFSLESSYDKMHPW